jgi:hypothetical protein
MAQGDIRTMISQLTRALYTVINFPEFNKDCLSAGQLDSKEWLVDTVNELNLNLGTIFICAGWYGTLATMIMESNIEYSKIRSFDSDKGCMQIADTFNSPWVKDNWRFKAITADIQTINYAEHSWSVWSTVNNRLSKPITDCPNTVINTSCEHIEYFNKWYDSIPDGKILILQSNNGFDIADHINCVESQEKFADQTPMSQVLFSGQKQLEKFTRYMRIGIK